MPQNRRNGHFWFKTSRAVALENKLDANGGAAVAPSTSTAPIRPAQPVTEVASIDRCHCYARPPTNADPPSTRMAQRLTQRRGLRLRQHGCPTPYRGPLRQSVRYGDGGGWRAASHLWSDRWLSVEGWPATIFAILMSSSRSGQWIPWPRPISRQCWRSAGVPASSRGYHARGTLIVRPSLISTVRASSVSVTVAIKICVRSILSIFQQDDTPTITRVSN